MNGQVNVEFAKFMSKNRKIEILKNENFGIFYRENDNLLVNIELIAIFSTNIYYFGF
jgi:hypothetical protein